jgi:hypothetical protein
MPRARRPRTRTSPARMVAACLAVAASPFVAVPEAGAAGESLAGCQYREMCVVDDDRIVYAAVGNANDWPKAASKRADRVINNGSRFDLVLYEHTGGATSGGGWALCVPRGRVVNLGGVRPAVQNQGTSHRWVPDNHCGGKITWLRAPGAVASPSSPVPRSVEIARAQLGVREVGVNKGKRVTEYQKSVRNDDHALGQAWCASFLTWLGLQANDPTPFRSAIVADWVRAANNRRSGLQTVAAGNVQPGDLVALSRKGVWEHMGIVTQTGKTVLVISGNTTAPDKGADGVFEKPLSNWTKLGFSATFIRNSA